MIIVICKWRLVDEGHIVDGLTKKEESPIVIYLNSKRLFFIMRKKVIKLCKFSLYFYLRRRIVEKITCMTYTYI